MDAKRLYEVLRNIKLLLWLSLLILFFPILVIFQRTYYEWKIKLFIQKREASKQIYKEEENKEFQKLLEQQSEEQQNQQNKYRQPEKRRAVGNHRLDIVFVKPEKLSNRAISSLTQKLRYSNADIYRDCSLGESCSLNTSLYFVNTFLSHEAKKYGTDFNLRINFHGIYSLPGLNKVGDIARIWGKDLFAVAKLQDAFESIINENNPDIGKDTPVVFLYFDNSFEKEPGAPEDKFYEYKKFRSFANYNNKRIYLNVYNFSPGFSTTVVEIVTHELLHLFGAVDKYLEHSDSRICNEKGYGDTIITPPLPQKTGDIMCLFVEYDEGKFYRGSIIDGTLVINRITAKEIGWVDD